MDLVGGNLLKAIKVTRKLVAILLIGFSCLFILLIAGYEITSINDENHKEFLDINTSKILQDINYLTFSNTDVIARVLAGNEFIKQLCLKRDSGNYDKTLIVLNSVLETSNIDICYVIDSKGVVVASSKYKLDMSLYIKGNNYSFRPYFLEAIKGNDVIYPALGSATKARGIYFSSPIISSDSKIIGVVVCRINMELIDKILKKYSHKIFITTMDGIVFSTNTKEFLYRSVFPISRQKLDSINKSRQFLDISIEPLELTIKNSTATLDSNKYYFSQKSIGKTGWKLLALSDFREKSLLLPMQFRFIVIILAILIILMVTIILLIKDFFKRRESEAKLKKLFHAVQQSSSTIVITDTRGVIEYVNPKFTELTGYTTNEIIGMNTNMLKSNQHDNEFYQKMWSTILSGEDWRGDFCNKKKNGEIYWEDAHISSVKDSKGRITNFIAVKEDITERRDYEKRLNIYATMDEMTGTFNRRSAMILMEKQLLMSKRQYQNFVIFFMDINGLKSVNDSLGHSYGDELISLAVRAIKSCLREADSLCRLGGDEFLIILPNTNLNQAKIILNRITDEVKKINNEDSYSFILSLSFGESEFSPESELTVDTLIHIADQKMYENKAEIKEKLGPKGIFR